MTTVLQTTFKTISIDGLEIFYREAGDASKPSLLLLSGFPSSSVDFENLMRELSDSYHLIAPDYPGFGHSAVPDRSAYSYTFHQLSLTMERFIDTIGLAQFTVYAFDYGAPIGFRIAARRPELIAALVVQNGNAYEEGIGPAFGAAMPFLQNRNAETEVPIRGMMTVEGIRYFYHTGARDIRAINPDNISLSHYFLSRPGLVDIHLDLLHDYSGNVAEYPTWQEYLRRYKPATLLVWGEGDPFFPIAAGKAFQKDLPDAQLIAYPTGHFALSEFHKEIANDIKNFLIKKGII
jgi:pimeloyl-ACP methyl ester carboxylesterase